MRDDRRHRRAYTFTQALAYQLDACCHDSTIQAMVVADGDGLALAASGDTYACDEVAARMVLVGTRIKEFNGTLLGGAEPVDVQMIKVDVDAASSSYVRSAGRPTSAAARSRAVQTVRAASSRSRLRDEDLLALTLLAACSSKSASIAGDDAKRLLIDRNWIDRMPETKDDRLHVYRFVPNMGGGVYRTARCSRAVRAVPVRGDRRSHPLRPPRDRRPRDVALHDRGRRRPGAVRPQADRRRRPARAARLLRHPRRDRPRRLAARAAPGAP